MTSEQLDTIKEHLWPEGHRGNVWMIVDAARNQQILPMLKAFRLEYYCLYRGPLTRSLEAAAPYLLQLDYRDPATHRFLGNAWDQSWGVFLKCDLDAYSVRRHLRGFLVVRDPGGSRLLFRYYDPRVLRVYLPTCVEDELQRMFGPFECFWTEGRASQIMLEFRLARGKLVQRTLSLAAGAQQRASGLEKRDDGPRAESHYHQGLLTLRPEQMTAFSRAEEEKFEAWMLTHLMQFFPKQCTTLGEAQVRELIQYGIQRARACEITSERDVCKFIDLMIVFGRDFDTDERSAWAGEILANRKTARSKIRSLYEAAETHLSRG